MECGTDMVQTENGERCPICAPAHELHDYHDKSHGFDAGNYAAAYETEDYEVAANRIAGKVSKTYMQAHMLGFFSSYELHEIPEEWRDEVERLRSLNLV
jgi:hypothetical protein